MFEKIGNSISLSGKVEEEIESAIRAGQLKPNQKLPTENELSRQFSVSRTAIREAIGRLTARGLIEVRKGSGTYVSEISIDDAREALNLFFELSTEPDISIQIIKTRQIIEPEIARVAAKMRLDTNVKRLELNLQQLKECKVGDFAREAELDSQFHCEIVKSTANPILELLMRPIYSLIPAHRKQVFGKINLIDPQAEKEILIKYHGDIVRAIKLKDGYMAFDTMRAHLAHTERNFLLDDK